MKQNKITEDNYKHIKDINMQRKTNKNGQPLKVAYINTDKLIPYTNNSRTHSPEQVQQIAGSIREFGFTNPILIDEENGIIAGHGRLAAAQLIKQKEVPTIMLKGLTDAQKSAYVIADNKLAINAGWDEDLLGIEMMDLQASGFDLNIMGFSEVELNNILDIANMVTNPEDEWAGMPDFDMEDATAFRSIIVHFNSQEHVDEFIDIMGQKITDKTKYIWHPIMVRDILKDKVYE